MTEAWIKYCYDVIQAFNELHYSSLLTHEHIIKGRTPINVGSRDDSEYRNYYLFEKNRIKYALPVEFVEELPILIDDSVELKYRTDVYDIITAFRSARFQEEKLRSFRELVDDLICFAHRSPIDYTLWKIIVFAAHITRLVCRVSSPPSFGKDSAVKVLGDLLGDSVVVSNPTTAKLEYRLTNKLIVLNELANLTGEEKRSMEHFLLSTGDLSNIYEKRSRATADYSARETYNISKLSLILAYNNRECYPEGSLYFDDAFQKATKERFLPLKFEGSIAQDIPRFPNAREMAESFTDDYKAIIRSIMWYRKHWHEELDGISYDVKDAQVYGLRDRWAANFNTIVNFIKLYANEESEARLLTSALYNRHYDYLRMVKSGGFGLFDETHPREYEDGIATEEHIGAN